MCIKMKIYHKTTIYNFYLIQDIDVDSNDNGEINICFSNAKDDENEYFYAYINEEQAQKLICKLQEAL